jgi:cytochrome c
MENLMKKTVLLIASLLTLNSSIFAKSEGKKIFETKCMSCHTMGMTEDIKKATAPPIKGVVFHMNEAFSNNKKMIEKHINDIVMNPTLDKAICQSVKRFGLMPSLKGSITKEELATVAKWMVNDLKAGHGKHKK